jgi:integrase
MVGKKVGRVSTMPKLVKALKALEVSKLTGKGKHAVGTVAGLLLSISPSNTRSWLLRTTVGTRRVEIGLGSYPEVTLAEAHERARTAKKDILNGINPIEARKAKRSIIDWTFERCAEAYMDSHEGTWKNVKHAQQWRNTLATYAFPKIGHKHVGELTLADVLSVIETDWNTKNETMKRVQNRIELVISWATVRGYRTDSNPAAWKGNLDQALPKPSKVNQRTSHKSLPYEQINSFITKLREIEGFSSLCLEFLILTSSRPNEVRGATWSEIDLDNRLWKIPAERMKAKREHRVPLSSSAMKLLESLPRFEGVDLLFPGRSDKPLSEMSMTALVRRLKVEAVPHGFRSTFTNWCAETTNHPEEVRQMALAHTIGDKTEAAYRRLDLFEKRRVLMEDWSSFIELKPEENVLRFEKRQH